MSPTLREINAKAQYLAKQEMSEDDKELAEIMEGWDAPELPEKLPNIIELLVSNYDKRFREMLCLSLNDPENEQVIAKVRGEVNAKMKEYPLFAY